MTMTTDLFYLALMAGLAAVFWIPNIVGIVATHGMPKAADFREPVDKPLTGWALRAKRVHLNMVENLAHFAALVIVAHLAGKANDVTALWVQIYFWSRVGHAVVYYAGIPFVRTVFFTLGFIAEVVIFVQIVA